MLKINEKTHLSTILNSLDNSFNNAKIYGTLYNKDLYYLDSLYRFIHGCPLELTNDQSIKLLNIYNRLSFQSKNICTPVPIKKYVLTQRPVFTQADSYDCNDYPIFNKILYWQEDLGVINSDVLNKVIEPGFLDDKLSDTYSVFEAGKNIEYINIGKLCFFVLNTLSTSTFEIKDNLGNIINTQFDITFIDQLNSTLMVSKNTQSYGDITFKIKKLT